MQTYWLSIKDTRGSARRSTSSQGTNRTGSDDLSGCTNVFGLDDKTQRVASWVLEVLLRFLKLIVAQRGESLEAIHQEDWEDVVCTDVAVIDEVAEIVTLPQFKNVGQSVSKVTEEVEAQLLEFVQAIALMYRNNYFHNFDHASHVTMVSTILLID
jgi:hypothetical protein